MRGRRSPWGIGDVIRFAALPLIGLCLLTAAWLWSAHDLSVLSAGDRVEGRISGILKLRDESWDVVTQIDTEIDLLLASGDRVLVRTSDYALMDTPMRLREGVATPWSPPPDWLERLQIVITKGRFEIGLLLEREARRTDDPDRIEGIVKRETSFGWFGLTSRPRGYVAENGTIMSLDPAPGRGVAAVARTMTVEMAFGEFLGAGDAVKREASVALDGYPVTWESLPGVRQRDFVLFQETFAGELRPLAIAVINGTEVVVESAVGKLKDEMRAYAFSKPCILAVGEGGTPRIIFIPHPDAVSDSTETITFLSALASAWFSRWIYPFMLALVGTACLAAGILFASLAVWPHQPRSEP